jgi:hypothetical protein
MERQMNERCGRLEENIFGWKENELKKIFAKF